MDVERSKRERSAQELESRWKERHEISMVSPQYTRGEKRMTKQHILKRPVRSNKELQHASLAVQFEFVMLATTHHMLQESTTTLQSPARDQAISNALLNSFLLAARSLLAFLYSYKPRGSDIIAEDFFTDPQEWVRQRPVPEPEMANGELARIMSKWLAHLTWDRVSSTRPLWGPFRIIWNIGSVMQSFLQLVDKDKVHPQLREDVALIIMTLQAQVAQLSDAKVTMAPTKDFVEFDNVKYFAR